MKIENESQGSSRTLQPRPSNLVLGIMRFFLYGFAHCLCFSTVHAFEAFTVEKDVRGVLGSSCVLMVETHGNSLGRFAASVKCFQGACRSRINYWGELFNELCLLFFLFFLLRTFPVLQHSFGRTFFRCFQLFSIFLACLHIHKVGKTRAPRPHSMHSMCKLK